MSSIQIAVVDSGWVLVGHVKPGRFSSIITLNDASVVRVWGTKSGLGEIAMGGPTKATVLDKIGTVYIERSQVKFMIDCDDAKWSGKL